MKCSEFKSEHRSELNINNLTIQGLHIEPYTRRVPGNIPILG
jgi:hypothetical protein